MKKAVVRHENNKPLWVSQNWAVNFYKDTGIRLELLQAIMMILCLQDIKELPRTVSIVFNTKLFNLTY